MVLYALMTQPEDTTSGGNGIHSLPEEPYPSFESTIDQQLVKADNLTTNDQREALHNYFVISSQSS